MDIIITTYFLLNEKERKNCFDTSINMGEKNKVSGMNNLAETIKKNSSLKKKGKKHFAQDAAKHIFSIAEDIPQVLYIPEKYDIIDSNVFAKLHLSNKKIRQIIIPSKIITIKENAFAGLIVTEAVHIPFNVKTIENNAFTLDKKAYIYCENGNGLYIDELREQGMTVITDVPFKSESKDIKMALQELQKSKNATRIPKYCFIEDFNAFKYGPVYEIEEIIIPKGVCVIEGGAFYKVLISKRIIIPSSVTRIGKNAFNLGPKAYVSCDKNSFAYYYCSINKMSVKIKRSSDKSVVHAKEKDSFFITNIFRKIFKKTLD